MKQIIGELNINFCRKNGFFLYAPIQKILLYICILFFPTFIFGTGGIPFFYNEYLDMIINVLISLLPVFFLIYTLAFKTPKQFLKEYSRVIGIEEKDAKITISVEWKKEFAVQIIDNKKKYAIPYKDIKKYTIGYGAIFCFNSSDQIVLIAPNQNIENQNIVKFLLQQNYHIKQRSKLL